MLLLLFVALARWSRWADRYERQTAGETLTMFVEKSVGFIVNNQ